MATHVGDLASAAGNGRRPDSPPVPLPENGTLAAGGDCLDPLFGVDFGSVPRSELGRSPPYVGDGGAAGECPCLLGFAPAAAAAATDAAAVPALRAIREGGERRLAEDDGVRPADAPSPRGQEAARSAGWGDGGGGGGKPNELSHPGGEGGPPSEVGGSADRPARGSPPAPHPGAAVPAEVMMPTTAVESFLQIFSAQDDGGHAPGRPGARKSASDHDDGGARGADGDREALASGTQPLAGPNSPGPGPRTDGRMSARETTAGDDGFAGFAGPAAAAENRAGGAEFGGFAAPADPGGNSAGVDDFDDFAAAPSAAAAAAAGPHCEDFDAFGAPAPAAAVWGAVTGAAASADHDDFDDFASVPQVAGTSPSAAGNAITPLDVTGESMRQDVATMLSKAFPPSDLPFSPVPPEEEGLRAYDLSREERLEASWFGCERSYVLWHRLALEGVVVDEMGETINRFHWKTSFVRRQLLAALQSRSRNQKLFVSENDIKETAIRASNGDLSAFADLAVGRKQAAFDSAQAWSMSKIPEAELRAMPAAELSRLSVELSLAMRQAAAQLDQWLDLLEQANMDKETHGKMISVLVATAKKKAAAQQQ